MHIMKLKLILGLTLILGSAVLGAASTTDDNRAPEIPANCDIAVPAGHGVAFHAYALGVQIYKWDGATWTFVGPEADLYASAKYRGRVATHYAGPIWESNSGSLVVGSAALPCNVDATAIPWLRLTAASSSGPGIFDGVTYMHRTKTVGGMRPTTPGTTIDQEARIPYTAEYYFYKEEN